MPGPVSSVDIVVAAYIDWNDGLAADPEFERDSIGEVDRYRVQSFELSGKRMQTQRRVVRVGLKKLEGLAVLAFDFRMPNQEPNFPLQVALGEQQLPGHQPSGLMRGESALPQACAQFLASMPSNALQDFAVQAACRVFPCAPWLTR